MSTAARTGTDPSTRGTRAVLAWLGGLVLVVVAIVVLVPSTPPPYAIASTEPDGTDILRRVLADLDVEMVEGPADQVLADLEPADLAVVFVDRLSDTDEAALAEHRAAGGGLFLADPRSALAPGSADGLEVVAGQGVDGGPGCDLLPDRMQVALTADGFSGVGAVDVPDLVEVPDGMTACWERDGTALVVQQVGGDGTGADDPEVAEGQAGITTVVADPTVLTNGAIMAQPVLGQFAHLFVPAATSGRVVVVVGDQPPPAGTGTPGEPPDRLVDAMWLAAIALGVYALARSRRHGRVLAEDPPVEVPASELAVGIAELLQRHGEVASAAARLRAELRAEIGPRVGAGGAIGQADLVDPVMAATELDRATVDRAIRDQPVPDTDALLDVAAAVRRVRTALTTPAAPADPADDGTLDEGATAAAHDPERFQEAR